MATDSKTQEPIINTLVVIGLGLIGGSVSKGLGVRGAVRNRIGVVRDAQSAELAVSLGVVDRASTSLEETVAALSEGDVVLIAVPTLAVAGVIKRLKPVLPQGVIVTDAASVKGSVRDVAVDIYGYMPTHLVLGHPIAGSEKSGVTAANANLYEQHRVILTPEPDTAPEALSQVEAMWQALGAQVIEMSVAEHDQVLGATSHLPHAIAYSLVDTLANDLHNPNIFRYAAGGFRDFTRIASSDPVMWHDIMRANREAVLQSLDLFLENLNRLKSAIARDDGDYLLTTFARAKSARDLYTQLGGGSHSESE